MDRFSTMESFVRDARSGSFTIAANQLGLSRALVSRHISSLEERLGVRLLNRSTRSLNMTDEGRSYLEFCERTLRDIEASERAIGRTRTEPVRSLKFSNSALTLRKATLAGLGIAMVPRYSVGPDLAAGMLVPVLPRFKVAPRPVIAVYPRAAVVPQKVQLFVDFMRDWAARHDINHGTSHAPLQSRRLQALTLVKADRWPTA